MFSVSFLSNKLSLKSSSAGSRAHFSFNHGESIFWVPGLWIGNRIYQPTDNSVRGRLSKQISASPSPWFFPNPCFFSQSITRRILPNASQREYFIVSRYCGFRECWTRVLRFWSFLPSSQRKVFMYVSETEIENKWFLKKKNEVEEK